MAEKPFYLTTTLPYVNADLHMGHALEFVRADIIARAKKLQGFDVYFNTGTDEHGLKIYEKAKERGMEPQAFVDESFARFKDSTKIFGLLEDAHFIRTTDSHHISAAQEFWKRCDDNGYIYKKNYSAQYCVGCEETKTDSELVNGECPVHPGRALETIEEENYFFKYSAFGEKLLAFYSSRPDFVVPDFRFNEIKAFVERGLEDFSISRLKEKMPWGIPVPSDDRHVMYVWFDALVNYIATLGWPDEGGNFEKYWKNGTPTQYCGKDNLRFQSAMWQAMLMAAGVPNSHQIVINGFITAEGGVKMSKTLGNVVDPKEIAEEYGTEALRFFLAKEIGSFEDSPFTKERFKASYNAHLANGIGNLSSRILTLSEKYLPQCPEIPEKSIPKEFFEYLNAYEISKAAEFIWNEVQALDKTIQTTEPFKVVKVDEEKGKALITDLVLRLYTIARMLNPIMPETNLKLKALIKANKKPETPLFMRKD
jgi:methionyl-tRNA synthetase